LQALWCGMTSSRRSLIFIRRLTAITPSQVRAQTKVWARMPRLCPCCARQPFLRRSLTTIPMPMVLCIGQLPLGWSARTVDRVAAVASWKPQAVRPRVLSDEVRTAEIGQNPPFTIVRYRVDRQPVRIPAYHRFVNSCLKRRSASSSPRVVSTTDLVLLTGSSIKPCLYRRSVDSQSNDFHALQPSCTVRYMSASTASSIFLVSGSTAPDDTSEWVRLGTPEVTGAKTA